MISAADWDAYNAAVSGMADGMAKRAELLILAWMDDNPAASVAEVREAARSIMEGIAQVADEAAATLAAEWYDERARASGASLESAVTAAVYSAEDVDRAARYQAKKLVEGDKAGFARRCGEFVRNDALKSLNETVIANVGRDSDRGARFARVMTGAENCAFCLMLAGRGAVYHTRATAGEFRRFHRGCDCKVVPSFSDDPMETLVEGRDPKRLHDTMKAIERETGCSFSDKSKRGVLDRYVRLHDPEWLVTGKPVAVDYSTSPESEYGRLKEEGDYSPDSIVDRKNEWRDLFVHHVLSESGFAIATRGGSDLDLLINGEPWEVKSPKEPEVPPKEGRELAYVESNVRSAVKQFKKRGIENPSIVFNNRYRNSMPDDAAEDELKKRMKQHGVTRAIFIRRDGTLKYLE